MLFISNSTGTYRLTSHQHVEYLGLLPSWAGDNIFIKEPFDPSVPGRPLYPHGEDNTGGMLRGTKARKGEPWAAQLICPPHPGRGHAGG